MLWNKVLAGLVTGGVIALLGTGTVAQTSEMVVIGNDRGGSVGDRAFIVDRLRAYSARVEIRGSICYSACTMYLGAGNVCVDPDTTFGFHGPQDVGTQITEQRFDHWSTIMGRYYNEPLRKWFMEDARYTEGILRVSGEELIRIGYNSCR